MKFCWLRHGNVFDPTHADTPAWMAEYAQCPTPFTIDKNTVRVFFATRPARDTSGYYVSHPAFLDLDRNDLTRVKYLSTTPVLELGAPGMFDEFGIMPSSVVKSGNLVYLYYTGWTRMETVPYTTAIGVAVSKDGGTHFSRIGPGPVLNINLHEPYMVNSPIVRVINGLWHMWYVSGLRWIETNQGPEIVLRQAHAISMDGLNWKQRQTEIMPQTLGDDECQDLLCPIRIGALWHAFFACRHARGFRDDPLRGYRLAHAVSDDLVNWRRIEPVDTDLRQSKSDWDHQSTSSTQFLESDGRYWMFYCGNSMGRQGFGIAELLVTP
jgi:sucrose-6-phosphate hydrolase SacC (GH32 family)